MVALAQPTRRPIRPEELNGLSLREAFRRFVLEDPSVKRSGAQAIKQDSRFERVFIRGHWTLFGRTEWPFAFAERGIANANRHVDPVGCLAPKSSSAVIRAADALAERWSALIAVCRRGELTASGLAVRSGAVEVIPKAVFCHVDFWLDAAAGDVHQLDHDPKGPTYGELQRKWIAVELRIPFQNERIETKVPAPSAPNGQSKKSGLARRSRAFGATLKGKQAVVHKAVSKLWPRGVPVMPVKVRDDRIINWIMGKENFDASEKTIGRYFRAKERHSREVGVSSVVQ